MVALLPARAATRGVAVSHPRRRLRDSAAPCGAGPQRVADQKIVTMLPELAFNNAFVRSRFAGYEHARGRPDLRHARRCSRWRWACRPIPPVIGCHEITHYVHVQQIAGFAWFWNLFGQVYSPQIGLDPWFDEGLAVYYETKLQPGHRPARLAVLARHLRRGLRGPALQRRRSLRPAARLPRRQHYLNGSQFVRFLAERYGEDKLWKPDPRAGAIDFLPVVGEPPVLAGVRQDPVDADRRVRRRGRRQPARPRSAPRTSG